MPELSDDMYCSQQIMVPPMFPYLLRQYAKAAIRSQPSDLLRWSTAYFRCLSLNLPPPIKPRLEYPIPKDYDGITPGWLRALLYQFQNTVTVDFKVLWDRWIGACLHHRTLIKILCLGGFTEPMAVPFLRFLALCCGFISENLTQTMIMICEVITEEPEGGSAMITVETFIDLYTFLANIDASQDQILINRYFTDDLLGLLEKKEKKKREAGPPPEKEVEREPTPEPEVIEEEEKTPEETKDEISCPDLVELGAQVHEESSDETMEAAPSTLMDKVSSATITDDKERVPELAAKAAEVSEVEEIVQVAEEVKAEVFDFALGEASEEGFAGAGAVVDPISIDLEEPQVESLVEEGAEIEKDVLDEVAHEDSEVAVVDKKSKESTAASPQKSEILTTIDQEEDINKYLDEVQSGEESPSVSIKRSEVFDEELSIGPYSETLIEEGSETTESKLELEEIEVEAIPGIGGIVPEDLLKAVVEYMKKCASRQHGMVMPRNIRHYSCPPLEVLDY